MDKKTFEMSRAAHALSTLTQKYNQVVAANKNLAGAYQQTEARLGQLNFLMVMAIEKLGGSLTLDEETLKRSQIERKRIDRSFDNETRSFTMTVRDRTPEEAEQDRQIEDAFKQRATEQAAANEPKIEIATSIPK